MIKVGFLTKKVVIFLLIIQPNSYIIPVSHQDKLEIVSFLPISLTRSHYTSPVVRDQSVIEMKANKNGLKKLNRTINLLVTRLSPPLLFLSLAFF